MNVMYSEKIPQWGGEFELLKQANSRLEETLGTSAERVKAEWDRTEDNPGRTQYTLSLSDWAGIASTRFTPRELHSADEVRYRLHRLWGDLLQIRSQKQLEKLIGNGGEEGDGDGAQDRR